MGSTGLKSVPPQYASFAHQPLFPQVQTIVQGAFINSTVDIFYVATGLLVVGLLAPLVLIRKSDMLPAEPGSKSVAVEV